MKKIALLMIFLIFTTGCANINTNNTKSNRLNIVTTVFPPYDIARQICGDNADIMMLVKPGMESHSYDPTPQDIIKINNADIFIYIGGESESWVDEILKSTDNKAKSIISMIDIINPIKEEHIEDMEHSDEHDDEEEYDEHIWTSPANMILFINEISENICETDVENKELYTKNANEYLDKIKKLDDDYRKTISEARNKTLLFADRFPFLYMTKEYGLSYYAAFPGCSEETEPSAKTMSFLIDKINKEDISAVFYIEFSNQKIADTICKATGVKKLFLHSCHNLSKEDFENGKTYEGIMRDNLNNIREAIQ